MAGLARLAVDDCDAATALVWLLIPGATRLANSLGDLSPDIDGLVAGQLWLEVRSHGGRGHAIAATILRNTRRAVMAEYGCGDAGRRRDRVWAETTLTEYLDEQATPVTSGGGEPDAMWQLRYLVELMIRDGVLTFSEANLLASAASDANLLDLPLRGTGRSYEPGRVRPVGDISQHSSGADRCQLLVVADQPHRRSTFDRGLDDTVEGQSVGHPCLVDDDKSALANARYE